MSLGDRNGAQGLAQRIEADIVARGWPVGECLGVEADLAGRYGVGRDLLRQAITLVGQTGLIEVRRGREGGVFVAAPSATGAAEAIRAYLDTSEFDFPEVVQAKRQFDDLALRLALTRQTDETAAAMAALIDEMQATPRWHLTLRGRADELIDRAAGNPYLALIRSALKTLCRDRADPLETFPSREEIRRHRLNQLRALVGQDLGLVLSENAIIHGILEREAPPAPPGRADPCVDADGAERGAGGLGQHIARDIKARILRGELAPGDRLGCQASLMESYGVGRGAVRDAIRMLEQHAMLRTVRGKTGGVYVTRLRSDSILRTVGLHLRALKLTRRAIMEVGEVLDPFVAALAASNAHRLSRPALEAVLGPLADTTSAGYRERSLAHYLAIGEVAANPVVSLMIAIQASLVEIEPRQPRLEDAALDKRAEMIAAIARGDPAGARAAMIGLRRCYQFKTPPASAMAEPRLLRLLPG